MLLIVSISYLLAPTKKQERKGGKADAGNDHNVI